MQHTHNKGDAIGVFFLPSRPPSQKMTRFGKQICVVFREVEELRLDILFYFLFFLVPVRLQMCFLGNTTRRRQEEDRFLV